GRAGCAKGGKPLRWRPSKPRRKPASKPLLFREQRRLQLGPIGSRTQFRLVNVPATFAGRRCFISSKGAQRPGRWMKGQFNEDTQFHSDGADSGRTARARDIRSPGVLAVGADSAKQSSSGDATGS